MNERIKVIVVLIIAIIFIAVAAFVQIGMHRHPVLTKSVQHNVGGGGTPGSAGGISGG